jgi:hypothetical protein
MIEVAPALAVEGEMHGASWPIAYRALLERAGSRQSADGGRVDGIGPRNIGHRIAQGHVRYPSSRKKVRVLIDLVSAVWE